MSQAINNLKRKIRDLIPRKLQVPLKYYFNTFQSNIEPEMKLLKYFVNKDDNVIDVGGNRGIYAYKLWKLGAKIEIFEPNPTCLAVLTPWVLKKTDVNLHSVGLSDTKGSVKLHIPIDKEGVEHDASATVENNNFIDSREQVINIETLDGYQFKDISFIKIDVEGHEYNVIKGAESLILSSKPVLLIEIEQRHNSRLINDVFESILKHGYTGYFLNEVDIISIKKFDVEKYQNIKNFDKPDGKYLNNFIFLNNEYLSKGKYDTFIKDFNLS